MQQPHSTKSPIHSQGNASTPNNERSEFHRDVLKGLTAPQKTLSSKYFYDATGDRLFQRIMASPDYYVSRAENEILNDQTTVITEQLAGGATAIEVVELGAGDGTKTIELLWEWMAKGVAPKYRPIDISANAIQMISTLMAEKLPGLMVQGMQGDNLEVLSGLSKADVPRIFLFLGSNIGNMGHEAAVGLMRSIRQKMNAADRLMIGFDLKKEPRRILKAYDDDAGITREFNLNLLRRINRELGADFKVECFEHAPSYDPKTGKAESHLVSTVEQEVHISGSPAPIHFHAWEAIHTETSQKYDKAMIKAMAREAGLEVASNFTDEQGLFADVIMKRLPLSLA